MKTLTKQRDYFDMDRHFVAPKVISPFYREIKRLPRKIKKDLKRLFSYKTTLTLGQQMWYRLNKTNPDYVRFLIKKICQYEQTEEVKSL